MLLLGYELKLMYASVYMDHIDATHSAEKYSYSIQAAKTYTIDDNNNVIGSTIEHCIICDGTDSYRATIGEAK
jgi:hypothetical protein